MLDPELTAKLDELEKKINAAYRAADLTRKYLMWTGIVTIALIVLPLIGLLFAIPSFLDSYAQIGNLGGF